MCGPAIELSMLGCVCVCLCVSCIDICFCWKKEDRVKVRVSYIVTKDSAFTSMWYYRHMFMVESKESRTSSILNNIRLEERGPG